MLPLVLFLAFCESVLAFPKLPGSNLLPWKRNVFEERQAEAQPTCACASVDPAAAAFIGYAPFAVAASVAPTPSGYVKAFTNENTYYSAEGGLGFTTLDTYDSELCATLCESVEGCTAFTLYYEQDANYEGTDVASSASIKCAFWAGSVSPSDSSSRGSDTYNAIIAGSNGYTSNTVMSGGGGGTEPSNVTSGSATASTSVSAISNAGADQISYTGSSSWGSTWPQSSHEGPAGGYPTSSPVSITTWSPSTHGGHPGSFPTSSISTTSWSPSAHGGHPGSFPTSSISTTSWSQSGHGDPDGDFSTLFPASKTSWSQTGHGGPYGGIPTPSSVFTSTSAGVGTERGGPGEDRSWTSEQSTVFGSTQTVMPVPVYSTTSSTTTSHGRGTYTHSTTTWSHTSSSVEPTHSSTTSRSSSSTTSHSPSIGPGHSSTTSSSTTSLGTYTHSLTTSSHLSTTSDTRPYGPNGFSAKTHSGRPYWPTSSSSSSTTTLRSHSSSSTSSTTSSSWSSTSSTTSSSSSSTSSTTSSSWSSTSSTTSSAVAEPTWTSSPNATYVGNSTSGDGYGNSTIPSIFLNSTHLIYNASTNMVYCTWTGQWYPYTANFSLASLNLTSEYGSNYTLLTNITEPVNATSIITSGSEIPTSTPPANITLPLNTNSTGSVPPSTSPSATQTPTPTDVVSWANATGNYTGLPPGYNLTGVPWHMIYNPSNNSWYCELTRQWYPAGGNFSLSDFNFTIPSDNTTSYPATNGSLPSNTTTPDNYTSVTSTTTTSSVSATPIPDSPTNSTTNSTGIPTLSYNGTYPCFNSSHLFCSTNGSVYCDITEQWYLLNDTSWLSLFNFTLPSYNVTLNSTYPAYNGTTSSADSANVTSTSTASSVSITPTPDSTSNSSTTNSTGVLTYPCFNSSHLLCATNGSVYCDITQQWYSLNDTSWLSLLNFTLPSYNTTGNSSYPIANTITSSVITEPASTESTNTSSSVVAEPTATASNATGYPGYNLTGGFSPADLNSSHLIYSASNNSIFCTITGLWYPAGNFSLASFNWTANYTAGSTYGLNYTIPSNTTDEPNSASTSVEPSSATSSSSSDLPSATPAPDNSSVPLNTTGSNYPAYYSLPFNASHMIYSPSNNSFYCELTQLWYPAGNVSSIPGFNMSTISIFNGTLPSYNVTTPSSPTVPDNSIALNATSTSPASSTSDTSTLEPETAANSTTNSTDVYPPDTVPCFNSTDLHCSANGSVYCDYTQQWYLPNDTSWMSLLNGTYSSFNASAYGINATYSSSSSYGSNSTSGTYPTSGTNTTAADNSTAQSVPTLDTLPPSATPVFVTVSATETLQRRAVEYLGISGSSGVIVETRSQASQFYIVDGYMIDSENGEYVGTETTSGSIAVQEFTDPSQASGGWDLSGSTLSFGDATFCYTVDSTLFIVFPDVSTSADCTTVILSSAPVSSASSITSSSQAPTPTPSASSNATAVNSTDNPSTYNGTYVTPGFNSSALNSSHLIFAANGSVYCDYTQQWYLPNDTSWLAFLNSTYLIFNASAYGDYNSSTDSLNSTYSNATEVSATSTTSSVVDAATPTPVPADSSDNSTTNSTGVFPQTPSFNISALNSTDHLLFYPNGSVWCDYTQTLYAANDTSWLSLLNYTSSAYNVSAYGDTNTTEVNATSTSTTSSVVDTATPTPSPADLSDNTTVTNSTGIFPQTVPTFNISALNSTDHLIFYPNGSVWCDYTQTLYTANDTSWLSLLNYTSAAYNSSSYAGFNSTGYSLNSTDYDINSTTSSATSATSSTIEATATPTPAPDAFNTTVTNSTGAEYDTTVPSFNSTDHLIFYPNGSVWCDYTQELYAPNDTSWMSLLNYTIPGYNASAGNYSTGYGFNSTAYGLNSTSVNATSTVSSSSEPTATATPDPVANATDPSVNSTSSSNSTSVYPQYNVTIPLFDPSILNSTDHLIFFANGSVWCDYTQTLYPANDTSWLSLFNATSSAFNALAYGGFNITSDNSTDYSYNATSLNSTTTVANATSSVSPADNSTSTPAPVTNSTDLAANVTAPTDSPGIYPSYNGTLTSLFNSSVINSTDHLIFYANGSVWCDYTQTLYPANDTSWESLLYTSSNSTGVSYNATGGFNASAYSYDVPTLNWTAPADNSTLVEPSATSTTSSSSDSPTPTPAPVDNSTAPANLTGVYPSSNDTGIFPSYNGSAIVNTTADLIFYANGSVWCDYTQQLYPANDTSWESLVAALANSTGAGYAPTNVTGAGYVPTNLTGAGYADSSTESSMPTASMPAPAQVASPTGYAAPTAAPYSNTTSSSTETDGSMNTTDGSAPEAAKVRRWKAPRERFRVR